MLRTKLPEPQLNIVLLPSDEDHHSAEVSSACRVTPPFSLHSAAEGHPTRQAVGDAETPGPAQRDRVMRSQHILVVHSFGSL